VFVVGNDGAIQVLWELDNGKWQGPTPITAPKTAPPGSSIAAAAQAPNDQLDVFFIGVDDRMQVTWEVNNGQWQGPAAISNANVAANAKLTAVNWPGIELRVLTRSSTAQFLQASVVGAGGWAPTTCSERRPRDGFDARRRATAARPPRDQRLATPVARSSYLARTRV
jgi:hypothetical protein